MTENQQMDSPSKQKKSTCKSCPWVNRNTEKHCFPPDALAQTIVQAIPGERIHSCHSNGTFFCTGYLAYCEKHLEDGIRSLATGRIGLYIGILDLHKIPQLPVFDSIEEMLESHRDRMDRFGKLDPRGN
jgi:Family of unknown function (DUF6283)